jgi:hypothetical protein
MSPTKDINNAHVNERDCIARDISNSPENTLTEQYPNLRRNSGLH